MKPEEALREKEVLPESNHSRGSGILAVITSGLQII